MKIEFTTRGILSSLFRQCRTFVTVFTFAVVGGGAYLALAKPQYEATGSLLVKFGRDVEQEIIHDNSMPQIISQNDRRETMQSNIDILLSHNLLLLVVHDVGPEVLYPGITEKSEGIERPDEAVVRKLWKSDLNLKSSQQSNVIDVSLMNGNPEVATKFVHDLFERFIVRQSEVFNKPQTGFLEEQVKQAGDKLQDSQQALRDFKRQNGVSSLDSELDELLRQKSDTGTVSLSTMDDAWGNLSELQAKEAEIRLTYRPESLQVRQAHHNVVVAQQQLSIRQGDLAKRTGKVSAQIDARITKLEGLRNQYNDLTRQVDIDEANYKNYLQRSEDARINATLNQRNITSIAVIDEPVVPMRPARPRKLLIAFLCVFGGLVFGSGLALAFETLDQRFTTPEQLATAVQVPVMASFVAAG